ncbi:MAG: sulfatase-like hydrolase/transferase [Thermoanaerobaculales bacterium]
MRASDTLTTEIPAGARALHLLMLVGVGVAQPLYDLLGRNPSFFVAHSATTLDLVLFVAIVSLALPAGLFAVQSILTQLARRLGSVIYLLTVAVLFAVVAAIPVKRLFPDAGISVCAVVILIGLAATFAYDRFPPLRSVMSFLSPSALLFPVLFLFFSPVTEIMGDVTDRATELTGVESTTPVVLIVFDELPVTSLMNEHKLIDPVAFPNFAKFAARAHWFRNATTVAQNTSYAVPAILTGRYPDATRAPDAAAYPENLFTFLAGSHELRVVEIFTRLCPDELNAAMVEREPLGQRIKAVVTDSSVVYLHIVLPSKLISGLPAIDSTWRDFGRENDARTVEDPHAHSSDSTWVFQRFLHFVTSVRRPTLFFLHMNLPHLPWKYLPSGQEYMFQGAPVRPHGFRGGPWSTQDWEVIQGWQRHLLQLGYADRLLGRLIERLQRTGLWDDALIIITADHGASFQPGKARRAATEETAADILGIPLLIKVPGQNDPQLHDTSARTIDILATIADVLKADLPWAIDGRSLLGEGSPVAGTVVIHRNKGSRLKDYLELPDRPNRKYRALRRKLEIFGSGEPLDNLFAIGEFASIVGRQVSDFPIAPGAEYSVELDNAWAFDEVDPDATFVPAQIVGHIETSTPLEQPRHLAMAVNGTIQAVTQSHSLPGRADFKSFSAMVPESAFAPGRNLVTVYAIEGTGEGKPRLVTIKPAASISYALTLDADDRPISILTSDGRTIALIPQALRGRARSDSVTLSGWAADINGSRPAQTVLVFSGPRFLFSVDVWRPVPAISERYGNPRLSNSGFQFAVPDDIPDSGKNALRIFAVVDSVATELVVEP